MADNVQLKTPDTGAPTVRTTEDTNLKHHQHVLLEYLNNNVLEVVTEAGLPVQLLTDFQTEVVRGNITGYSSMAKFGQNPLIDTGTLPEDLWNGGGIYTGQPDHSETPETVEVFSGDPNDSSNGTGARTIRLFGLDAAWAEQTEDIILAGATPVVSTNIWRRLNRAYVLTAGTIGSNAGEITVRHTTTTANVFAVLPVGTNQTTIAAFTIPAGKTGYLHSFYASLILKSGASGDADVSIRVREENSVYRARKFYYATASGVISPHIHVPLVLPEKSDIVVRVDDVSDSGSRAAAEFEILMIDNA